MKSIRLIAVACALAGVSPVFAGTIDFEAAPAGQLIGSFYSGVTFGTGVIDEFEILPAAPSHSGSKEASQSDITNPNMSFTFATPESTVSFWFTTLEGCTITAYTAGNVVVGTPLVEAINSGTISQVTLEGPNITTVVITDSLGLGGFETIDDLSAPGISGLPAPDATSTLALFGISALGLLAIRRKVAAH